MVALFGMGAVRGTTATTPPPTGFGVPHLVGGSVNYAGHPSIADGGLQADFTYFDNALRVALGLPAGTKVLAGPHGFNGGWYNTFAASAVSWAPGAGYGLSVQNMKIGGPGQYLPAAGGSWDAALNTYAQSVPDGHLHVIVIEHEPENNGAEPDADGGSYQNTYGPRWSQMQARFAALITALGRPNVYLAVVHMGFTWPASGDPGGLNPRGRDIRKWNPWAYMTDPAVKARTILAPDVYTDMTGATTSTKLVTKHGRIISNVQADGWGVSRHGITEHTINNDALAADSAVAAVWRDDVRVHLRNLAAQDKLAYYMVFNTSSGLASGVNGWVDLSGELTEFGEMARELNAGGSTGGGTTGIAFRAAAGATANTSTPAVTVPSAAQVGDYAVIQFSCSATVTVTDPAGWTVLAATDSGNVRTRVYGRVLTSGQPGSAVGPTMSGTSRWVMQCLTYSGVHATTPQDATPAVAASSTANTVQTTPTITTVTAAATVVQLVTNRGTVAVNTTSWTPPAGWTGRQAVYPAGLPGTSAAAADKAAQPVGTYGGDAWTSDASLGSFVGVTLALRPA